ncbi:PD-(D/E)XK motif protein [Gemmatimonadota bacterium]
MSAGPGGKTRIHLQLSDTRYREVFRALCSNACEVTQRAASEKEAVSAFHQRLRHWQSFLQRHGPEGLSEQERCGLFGELLILRDLILPVIEAGTAVAGWRGCKRAAQDFQYPNRAIEVKTTRAAIPDRVSVSSVQQLDEEGMQHLFLTVVHVNENETAGETLPELVSSLRSAVSDSARDLLDSGLGEVGYSDAHAELYARTKYLCRELLHFEVSEGFPRLSRGQIPDGVKGVRYEISIDSCRPFKVDQDTLLQLLGQQDPVEP